MQQLHYKPELPAKKRSFYSNSYIIVFEMENLLSFSSDPAQRPLRPGQNLTVQLTQNSP